MSGFDKWVTRVLRGIVVACWGIASIHILQSVPVWIGLLLIAWIGGLVYLMTQPDPLDDL